MVKISINKIKYISVFVAIMLISFAIFLSLNYFYGMWPLPIKSWTFKGVVFNFREDLKSAISAPASPTDCRGIYDEFHNYFLRNVTIYVNQDTTMPAIANVEATEFAYKLTAYYTKEPIAGSIIPSFNGALMNSSTDTNSSLTNAKIFIITPPAQINYGVHYINYSLFVEGSNVQQLDLATEKALMCIFGMNLTYGLFTYSPAFQ